ncbi:MAG: hypothetical protein MRZ79_02435 [Bacteroidia bacterium]|nr:hypothetical protein [Bacteroidia bacterium]
MSYTDLFKNECKKAKALIESKLGRPMSRQEIRSLTRLSNLTFMEMILQDFEFSSSEAETERALQNMKTNAEDRFHLAIDELDQKIQAAFGVDMDDTLKNLLRRNGNGIDLHSIQDAVNEHQSVLPKFVRKNRVKKSLETWEDRLRSRRA